MLVKPAPGRTVRRPDTMALLAAEGESVPREDDYWIRRLRDGDVILLDDADPAPAGDAAEKGE